MTSFFVCSDALLLMFMLTAIWGADFTKRKKFSSSLTITEKDNYFTIRLVTLICSSRGSFIILHILLCGIAASSFYFLIWTFPLFLTISKQISTENYVVVTNQLSQLTIFDIDPKMPQRTHHRYAIAANKKITTTAVVNTGQLLAELVLRQR
jgi:hypothetical protein